MDKRNGKLPLWENLEASARPKNRYSFECAAEFGNSYGQDYEDLFWWIKRSLMAGMNAQVLHGASYSGGYWGVLSENGNIPGTQWPGYAFFTENGTALKSALSGLI
ncbi:hypothetical protein D5282_22165 [bacterium 1xD8-48]|nr:hypothetical protein [bacterium 1xD8-48]